MLRIKAKFNGLLYHDESKMEIINIFFTGDESGGSEIPVPDRTVRVTAEYFILCNSLFLYVCAVPGPNQLRF